ncbi:MAG: NAD(P)H-dependent glycerol-3-phosphate dehydrogenase [Legionellales bacterium]|jgi:glycerol-3-phosphate dehydrogenase (NAD(P)+)
MTIKSTAPIAVLGAGSWGCALALVLADNNIPVNLWGHSQSDMLTLKTTRKNKYLADCVLPDLINVCVDIHEALDQCSAILIVVPSHAFTDILKKITDAKAMHVPIAWGTKGLTDKSELLSDATKKLLGEDAKLCVLSGPSFAQEVAQKQPTAITAASADDSAYFWQTQLHTDYFRVYTTHDMIGAQLGGACKNVLAIAVGIADGLGLGANTRAALMTRGFAELLRLGKAMGAQESTLMGLSGIGDLILTCSENQSRNRRFGVALGQGKSITESKKAIGQVVEGEQTTQLIYELAQRLNIEMPITEQVYQILYNGQNAKLAVKTLLERVPTEE